MRLRIFIILIAITAVSCQSQNFDKVKWQTREDPAFPPSSREAMVNDLLSSNRLNDMKESQVIDLLGFPDYKDSSTLNYSIVVDYGFDIDPIYTKILRVYLDKDSSVRSVNIEEWKDTYH